MNASWAQSRACVGRQQPVKDWLEDTNLQEMHNDYQRADLIENSAWFILNGRHINN